MSDGRSRPASDVQRLLDETTLPEPVRTLIAQTAQDSGLRPMQQVDVARELVAHFEDGIAAGRGVDSLIAEFGSGALAARLIARGKKAGQVGRVAAERVGARGDSIVFVILRDLRYALRRLRQSPAFTAVAIASLALGVGANTAIFSIVNGVLLRELPFAAPEELVSIYWSNEEYPASPLSYPDYLDVRDGTNGSLAQTAGFNLTYTSVERPDGAQNVAAEAVSGNFFETLGLQPAVGRLIGPDDNTGEGANPVVVLMHRYWQQQLGGRPEIVGSELRLSGIPMTVIGVAPPSYDGMMPMVDIALIVPQMMVDVLEDGGTSRFDKRQWYSTFVVARRASGVSVEQARASLDAVAARLRQEMPEVWRADNAFRAVATRDVVLMPGFDEQLSMVSWMLLGVVGLVLLIACANLASFLLARAVDRRKEIAVRLSLGATRGKLVGQLLVETVMLSLIGGTAGIVLAAWVLGVLGRMELPLPVPMDLTFAIDGRVLAFSFAISILAGIAFGLVPALQATRGDIVGTLRDETAGGGQGARSRLRSALVVAQVAVSVLLLVSAGLFLRSLSRIVAMDPGFGTQGAAIVSLSMPRRHFDESSGRTALEEVRRQVEQLPGVTAASAIGNMPLEQLNNRLIEIAVDGVPPPPGSDWHGGDWTTADPRLFDALGIEIVAGRTFDDSDTADARMVAIVSQEMARRFWGGDDAIGRTFRNSRGAELTVVGIAEDIMVRSLGEPPRLMVYRPLSQVWDAQLSIVAATDGDARVAVNDILALVRQQLPEASVFQTRTMEQHLEVVRFPARATAVLFATFAALALALATIGLYGTISYTQARRVREMGIRMSLGADGGSVVRLLLRGGVTLTAIGAAIGLALALVATRLMSGLLVQVDSTDPVTFGTVLALIGSVALVASWLPARRAARVSPVEALRSE